MAQANKKPANKNKKISTRKKTPTAAKKPQSRNARKA